MNKFRVRPLVAICFAIVILTSFSAFSSIIDLEDTIRDEIQLLNYPPLSKLFSEQSEETSSCDVAIIGGGMAGMSIAFNLKLLGIPNVQIFDAAPQGKEGPWTTSARMLTLRSGKSQRGSILDIPHLTFRAWFEAQEGVEAWKSFDKIPVTMWSDYLQWMRTFLGIPINNDCILEQILPHVDHSFTLEFCNGKQIRAHQIVLATGRAGFGGYDIPEFVQSIPKCFWAHTGEVIDPIQLSSKRVCVIGCGASAFDTAATALEHGANHVQLLARRERLPKINYFVAFASPGANRGYFFLDDKVKYNLFRKAIEAGIPPPEESLQRAQHHPAFAVQLSTSIEKVVVKDNEIELHTNQGMFETDFLILATGYAIDGLKQPELALFFDKILLWEDRNSDLVSNKLGKFPYLGPYFEFLEKFPGSAPYLMNIHCFNYGAFLSHGRISGDIDCIEVGVRRIVEGIVIKRYLSHYNQKPK